MWKVREKRGFTIATMIAFKGALKVAEVLRERFRKELLQFLLAFRLLSVTEPLRLDERHRQVSDTFGQDIDLQSLLLVGPVQAVLPRQVSDYASTLHNVYTSYKNSE